MSELKKERRRLAAKETVLRKISQLSEGNAGAVSVLAMFMDLWQVKPSTIDPVFEAIEKHRLTGKRLYAAYCWAKGTDGQFAAGKLTDEILLRPETVCFEADWILGIRPERFELTVDDLQD